MSPTNTINLCCLTDTDLRKNRFAEEWGFRRYPRNPWYPLSHSPFELEQRVFTAGVSRSQPLVADVTVSNMSLLPPSASPPQLPGQTQATADVLGNIQLNGVVLLAAPGLYRLSVALPAFPQVCMHC